MGFLLPLLALLPMTASGAQEPSTLKAYWDRIAAINKTETDDDLEAWARFRRGKAVAKEFVRSVRIEQVPKDELLPWSDVFYNADDREGSVRLVQRYLDLAQTDAERFKGGTALALALTSAGKSSQALKELEKLSPPKGQEGLPFRNAVQHLLEKAKKGLDFEAATRLYRRAGETLEGTTPTTPAQPSRERDGLLIDYAQFVFREKGKEAGKALLNEALVGRPGKGIGLRANIAQMDLIGQRVPELKIKDRIGSFPGFPAWRGKVVLAVFTAHWCGPCIGEVPVLAEMLRRRKDLRVVGVTAPYGFYGEEKGLTAAAESARVATWMRKYGMTWPLVFTDESDHLMYGVQGLPHIVLIDKKGIVRSFDGGFGGDLNELEREIESLSRE